MAGAMTFQDVHDRSMAGVLAVKEYVCRNSRRRDAPPTIDLYRDGVMVAIAIPPKHDRDAMLRTFKVAAQGLDADCAAIMFEGWVPAVRLPADPSQYTDEEWEVVCKAMETNPATGQPWRAGEMGELATKHDGIAKGYVCEALGVMSCSRAGDVRNSMTPYRYAGGHVVFEDEYVQSPLYELVGTMPETMIETMNTPSASQLFPVGLDELSRGERDILAAQLLDQFGSRAVLCMGNVDAKGRVRILRNAGVRM